MTDPLDVKTAVAEEKVLDAEEAVPDKGPAGGYQHLIGPIAFILLSSTLMFDAIRTGVGDISYPGPGFWPLIASTLALGFSIVSCFIPNPAAEGFSRGGLRSVGIAVGLMIVFVVAVQWIGFIIPSFLMTSGLLLAVGRVRLVSGLVTAAIVSGVSYAVFSLLLGVSLDAF